MIRSTTTPLLARRERAALCDLALVLGGDAPTLCGGWDASELVAHLLVREYDPIAGLGLVLPPLSGLADRRATSVARKDFGVLVERLRRRGPTPLSIRPLDHLFNTLEYFVHHEDLRRAQPGWEPRELEPEDLDRLWSALRRIGPGLLRSAGPLAVRRTDTGASATLRPGSDPVTVAGPPTEVLLFCYGRTEVRDVQVTGPPEAVARVERTP